MNVKSERRKIQRRVVLETFLRCVCVSLAALPAAVYGLGSAIPNQDAAAIARGNAFIATANSPAAIYYNPAGITQLEGTYAQFGVHNLALNSEFESLDGSQHNNSKFAIASVPQFYFTRELKNTPFTIGAGTYAPFGLGVKWGGSTPFRTLALESRLAYLTFNPVIAWKILPNLSIAAGPTINYAKVTLRQGIGLGPGDRFIFEGNGWDLGATAGLLWKPAEKWAVGVDYRSPTRINFDGKSTMKPYSGPEDTSAALNFPQSVGVGVAFTPESHWNIETYAIWTDWDVVGTTIFKKQSGNIPFALNWESSFMAGIGATRSFDNGWFVSAGYFFSQHSTSTANFTPLVPDTDLHVGSIGFGYKGTHWNYALSFQLITGPARTVVGSQPSGVSGETADGKYHWFNQAVNFSVGYHF